MTDPLLVLIPAHNEGSRIGRVIDGIFDHRPEAEVLVIDDGSSDDTERVARAHGARTIRHPFNLGYGAALHTGYHYALRRNSSRLVQMDGDGQHDPASLDALLDGLDRGADVVVGSRYREGNAPRTSLLRLWASRMFAWIVTRWTGVRITDPTSGFQAMSRRAIREVARDSFPEDYPDADVLIAHYRVRAHASHESAGRDARPQPVRRQHAPRQPRIAVLLRTRWR